MTLNSEIGAKQSDGSPVGDAGAPPNSDRAQPSVLPKDPDKPSGEKAVAEGPYRPYANLPERQAPYEPYKGM
jgi:hypothetical protein